MKVIYLFDVTETECHYSCETVRENTSGWLDKQSCLQKRVKMEWGEESKVLPDLNTKKIRNPSEYN